MTKLASLCIAGLLALLLASAATAQATTVIVGSPLTAPFEEPGACGVETGCQTALTKLSESGAHAAAPVDGTITSWTVLGASETPGYGVSVMKRNSASSFTVTASSALVQPGSGFRQSFPTSLPIHAGEFVALTIPYEGGIGILHKPSTEAFFTPPLSAGETGAPAFEGEPGEEGEEEEVPWEVGFNATLTYGETPGTPPASPVVPAPLPPVPAPEVHCVVPKVKGLKAKAAKKKIRKADCAVGHIAKKKGVTTKTGKVVKQRPNAGKVLAAGAKVKLVLG